MSDYMFGLMLLPPVVCAANQDIACLSAKVAALQEEVAALEEEVRAGKRRLTGCGSFQDCWLLLGV